MFLCIFLCLPESSFCESKHYGSVDSGWGSCKGIVRIHGGFTKPLGVLQARELGQIAINSAPALSLQPHSVRPSHAKRHRNHAAALSAKPLPTMLPRQTRWCFQEVVEGRLPEELGIRKSNVPTNPPCYSRCKVCQPAPISEATELKFRAANKFRQRRSRKPRTDLVSAPSLEFLRFGA